MPPIKPSTIQSIGNVRIPTMPKPFVSFSGNQEQKQRPSRNAASSATTSMSSKGSIGSKLIGDVLVAIGVTGAVSPSLTIVDKALVQLASGTSRSLWQSVQDSTISIVRHPVEYVKSPTFLWMWATYAVTYSAANALRTVMEHRDAVFNDNHKSKSSTKGGNGTTNGTTASIIFVGTTAVNTTASLIKDRAYARLFGSTTASGAVPNISYALWMARDLNVIGSSFILPQYVSPLLSSPSSSLALSPANADRVAQVVTPMAAQVVAGPLHFFALDCYNRPNLGGTVWRQFIDRSRLLYSCWGEIAIARIARILPAYGVAGVWNMELRSRWREYVTKQEQMQQVQAMRNRGKERNLSQTYTTSTTGLITSVGAGIRHRVLEVNVSKSDSE